MTLVSINFHVKEDVAYTIPNVSKNGGEFILAISPDKIAGPNWNKHSEEFFDKMKSMNGVRLPGERRHKNRLNLEPRKINEELINKIRKLSS